MKTFVIRDRVYFSSIYVRLGGDIEEAQTWFTKRTGIQFEPDERVPDGFAASTCGIGKQYMMYFRDKRPGGGVVAHEAFHITHRVLKESGMTLTDQSQEAYAYYLDWLIRQVGNKIW